MASDPALICAPCGDRHGTRAPSRSTTWHIGPCGWCGATDQPVTEARDYGVVGRMAMAGDLVSVEHANTAEANMRDASAIMKKRWADCKRIGDTDGMTLAGQIADECDDAAYVINRLARMLFDATRITALQAQLEAAEAARDLARSNLFLMQNDHTTLVRTINEERARADAVEKERDEARAAALQTVEPDTILRAMAEGLRFLCDQDGARDHRSLLFLLSLACKRARIVLSQHDPARAALKPTEVL